MKSARERFRGVAFAGAAAVLLIAALLLHFWRIGSAPPGFYGDESAHAYNAYCIALTGADEYGVPHPMFFRSFGEYKDPVAVYSLVPFVRVLGLQRWVARFPSGLYLMASAIVFALLVQRYCQDRWLSIVAGFCFSMIPWVFATTRSTTPYSAMLLGMTAGWLLTLHALEDQSYWHAVGAGAAWAFAMYSYSVGRPVSVLLLICFGVSYFREWTRRWKVGLTIVVSWVVSMTPMMVAVARNPAVLTSRFQGISVYRNNPGWAASISSVVTRYLEYFGPQFLFLNGDPNLRQHTGFGGELYLFLFPLVLAGLYYVACRVRTQPRYCFLGLGVLVYPVAAALTEDHLHSGRCVNGVIFWALIAAIGAHFLCRERGVKRSVLVLACCVGVVEMTMYLSDYFGDYQVRSRLSFSAPLTEALEDSFRVLGKNETLYVSRPAVSPLVESMVDADFKPIIYADILFFGKIDPRIYQRSGVPRNRVRPYEGVVDNPGLVLCARVTLKQGTLGRTEEIRDPIPVGAELLETKPWYEGVQFEVYRVK